MLSAREACTNLLSGCLRLKWEEHLSCAQRQLQGQKVPSVQGGQQLYGAS